MLVVLFPDFFVLDNICCLLSMKGKDQIVPTLSPLPVPFPILDTKAIGFSVLLFLTFGTLNPVIFLFISCSIKPWTS